MKMLSHWRFQQLVSRKRSLIWKRDGQAGLHEGLHALLLTSMGILVVQQIENHNLSPSSFHAISPVE
jgi:hypothetical protein